MEEYYYIIMGGVLRVWCGVLQVCVLVFFYTYRLVS